MPATISRERLVRPEIDSLTIYEAAVRIADFCLERPKMLGENLAQRKLGQNIVGRVRLTNAEGIEEDTEPWVSAVTLSTPNDPRYAKASMEIVLPFGVNPNADREDLTHAYRFMGSSAGVRIGYPHVGDGNMVEIRHNPIPRRGESYGIETHTVGDVDGYLENMRPDSDPDEWVGFYLADAVATVPAVDMPKPFVLLVILELGS